MSDLGSVRRATGGDVAGRSDGAGSNPADPTNVTDYPEPPPELVAEYIARLRETWSDEISPGYHLSTPNCDGLLRCEAILIYPDDRVQTVWSETPDLVRRTALDIIEGRWE